MAGKQTTKRRIHPVILSGGAGTRLWPLSRALYPKQLLALASERTMLQETVARFADTAKFDAPIIVCNDAHRFIVAEQLREQGIAPRSILLEPEGRNTAPAAAIAALVLAEVDADAMMLMLPSDHVIGKAARFHKAVATAARAASRGALVTFGIAPTGPETGYGYIRIGDAVSGIAGCHEVRSFVEKPDLKTAKRYLADGDYFWNSGIFLFRVADYLGELERLQPETVAACRAAIDRGREDLDFFRLDGDAFAKATAESIDYAVMEHTRTAAVVPVDMGWNDVGSWSALRDISDIDDDGNVLVGDVITEDVHGSYIRSEDRLIAAIGVRDMVIVATDDSVLAVPRDRVQDVKKVVERLRDSERSEHTTHTRVYRPWGHYQNIDLGERFQVKRITVNPGAQLSLQKHHHRAEHWIVVNGTAKVTRGDESLLLHENQSTYIPLGVMHRLENPGMVPLNLIEVQSGGYLGEDDIVRFEDDYGRD